MLATKKLIKSCDKCGKQINNLEQQENRWKSSMAYNDCKNNIFQIKRKIMRNSSPI